MPRVPSSLARRAQRQFRVEPAPLGEVAQGQSHQWGAPSPHPESHSPGSSALQVQAVRPVPVAIDDVHPAVAVEVSQRHSAPVLVGVIQPWGAARGQGETGTPPCLLVPSTPPGMCSIVPRQVLHGRVTIPALMDAPVHLRHCALLSGALCPQGCPPGPRTNPVRAEPPLP